MSWRPAPVRPASWLEIFASPMARGCSSGHWPTRTANGDHHQLKQLLAGCRWLPLLLIGEPSPVSRTSAILYRAKPGRHSSPPTRWPVLPSSMVLQLCPVPNQHELSDQSGSCFGRVWGWRVINGDGASREVRWDCATNAPDRTVAISLFV